MSTSLTLRGLRGGVGVSSLVAAIGHALQSLGERVLLVDMCPENLLRLHFNLPLGEGDGWARASLDGRPWNEAAWRLGNHLYLLPYGRLDAHEQVRLELHLDSREPELWARRQASLAGQFDWILFDLPQRLPGHCRIGPCDLAIGLLEADPACHALLQQSAVECGLLLVNRFDPLSQLQRDLLLIWQQRLGARLLPQAMHRDTAMAEALAHKQPVGHYAPASVAAQDALNLASWCLAHRAPSLEEPGERVSRPLAAGIESAEGGRG